MGYGIMHRKPSPHHCKTNRAKARINQTLNTIQNMSAKSNLDPLHDAIPDGKHVGSRIPRLAITNPGWLYWAINFGSLVRSFDEKKLQSLFRLTTRIAIPPDTNGAMVADYFSTEENGLLTVKLRPATQAAQGSPSGTLVTKSVLDLGHDYYDYRGVRRPIFDPIVDHVIDLYFDGSKGNVTEEAAIRFFSNQSNFAPVTRPTHITLP
jgi:hypothetical protein